MRRSILNLALAALLGTVAAVTAPMLCYAMPINYTVSGTTDLNNDGHTETFTGSFTFDTSNNTESNVSITVSGGDATFDGTFTQIASANNLVPRVILAPAFGVPFIEVAFASALNVSPDAITEVDFGVSGNVLVDRTHETGSAVFAAAAVPEPSSIALLATGLLGLGLLLYRRRVS